MALVGGISDLPTVALKSVNVSYKTMPSNRPTPILVYLEVVSFKHSLENSVAFVFDDCIPTALFTI